MFKHMDGDCYYPKRLYEMGDQTNVASNDTFQRGTMLDSGASLKCFVFSLSKGNGLFGAGGLGDGCTHHIHRVRRRSVICQLSHNVFMAHKSGHMNRRESRLPETQKYAALKHWELHAKANITSFQNAHVVFQKNSISDWNTLRLTLLWNASLLCMKTHLCLRLN